MAKRKRNNTQASAVKKQVPSAGIPSPPSDSTTLFEPTNASSIVLPEDIEISVETLQTLAQYPTIIKSKACKDLRTAVYGFRQACTTGLNAASGENYHCLEVSQSLTFCRGQQPDRPYIRCSDRWQIYRCIDPASGDAHS